MVYGPGEQSLRGLHRSKVAAGSGHSGVLLHLLTREGGRRGAVNAAKQSTLGGLVQDP